MGGSVSNLCYDECVIHQQSANACCPRSSHPHSPTLDKTTDVHPRSTLPASTSPSPAPSRQRPRLPRCILVCIISITSISNLSYYYHRSHFLSEFPVCVFLWRCPWPEKCLNCGTSVLASTLPRPHHREHPLTFSQPAHPRIFFPSSTVRLASPSLRSSVLVQLHSLSIWRGGDV